MAEKKVPINKAQLEEIIKEFPTPFHLYVEEAIRKNVRRLQAAFAWVPQFKEHFAVKATPNPYILKILKEEGCGADCSSLA
ncbi:MAG: diaminopimelate decarboxylase, partial [Clostridia bacterium]|nr:diaminopimelate decarboxylase [Clostridia bacterium]